ncbi:hypothetical protein D6D06_03544 [Aureobasidium pullulans]|nr:hypothetical protein D6D06_03544 [Aureobasidium pullulans]THZ02149.1 hypothetical protein D6C95_03990 [Aureobasidium pullulans]
MGSSKYNHLEDEVTFGATVDTPTKSQNHLAPNVFDTPKSLSPVVTVDAPSTHDEQLTPFYAAPSAEISRQTLSAGCHSDNDLESARKEGYFITSNPVASDLNLPADMANVSAVPTGSRLSFDGRTKECTMWPTKQTLRNQDQAERAKRRAARSCGCNGINAWWSSMSKKQRLMFQVLIAAFIVAVACGLGIGISKAVGAGVFAGKGQSKPIADA